VRAYSLYNQGLLIFFTAVKYSVRTCPLRECTKTFRSLRNSFAAKKANRFGLKLKEDTSIEHLLD